MTKKRSSDVGRARYLALFLVLCVFAMPLFAGHRRNVERGIPRTIPVEGESLTLESRMRHYRVPGLSVAVWKNGKLDWTAGYGDVSADTPMQAGAISKSLSAVATLRVLARHKVPLDADVNAHLTSWKLPADGVTIEQILSHTAGLNVPGFPGFERGDPIPSPIDELEGRGNTQALRVVGNTSYSSGGYLLLQQLLVDLEKKPIEAILEAEVLRPAKMRRSTFAEPLPPSWKRRAARGIDEEGQPVRGGSHLYPEKTAAGLWTTAADVARFVIALQTAKLLPRSDTDRMIERNFGVFAYRTHYFAHAGGTAGFSALYIAHRKRADGVVILANHRNAQALLYEVVRAVAKEYGWPDLAGETRKLVATDPSKFAGRYRVDPDDVASFRAAGSQLIVRRTGVIGETPLDPIGVNEFADRDSGVVYVFADDQVAFAGITAKRTREAIPAEITERDPPTGVLGYDFVDRKYVTEERLRARGMVFLEQRNYRAALAMLKLNAERHPESAAAHDALATAQLAMNDVEAARASSRRVLEVLPADWTHTASWRQVYRKRAEQRLRE